MKIILDKLNIFFSKKYLFVILLFILLLAAFFRLYRIREYIAFLGDEGRDVLVVKRMIVDHKFTLLGPITSLGSMYMGPIYYYFMIPFLWLWNFDPVGPAIMVVLFSLATIYLIFKLGTKYFHPIVGIIASFLYAISPLPIIYGRSSWNPNIVPFFSILIIYSLFKIIIDKKDRWILVIGLSLGIIIQLHYVTLMLIPVIIICLSLIKFRIKLKYYFYALISYIVGYSPFLLFEVRHQFVNTMAVWRFFWQQKNDHSLTLNYISNTIQDIVVRLFWRLVVIENAELTKLFIIFIIITLYFTWVNKKTDENLTKRLKILLIWFLVSIISFSLYSGIIYDYYLGSLFPFPYLLTGILIYIIWDKKRTKKFLAVTLLLTLVIFNLRKSPLRNSPNNLVKNTQEIAQFVYDKTSAKPYNFALIAEYNSDHAYRYFLELWGNPPVTIENPDNDPERKTVTSQLLIVCEEKICLPLGHPLWEIAGFGQAEIINSWKVSTAQVFQLGHYKQK